MLLDPFWCYPLVAACRYHSRVAQPQPFVRNGGSTPPFPNPKFERRRVEPTTLRLLFLRSARCVLQMASAQHST
eukprot:6466182-Amphidinium_carterae.1